MNLKTLLLQAAVLGALAAPLCAEFVIDDFSAGDSFSLGRDPSVYGYDPLDYPGWIPVPVPGYGEILTFDPGTILGGYRHTGYDHSAGSSYSPTIDYSPGYGVSCNSSWDNGVAYWTLSYGSEADLNADFTNCGNDRITLHMSGQIDVDVSGDDSGPFGHDSTPCTLTVWSHGTAESVSMDLYSDPQIGTYGEPGYYPGQGPIDWTFLFSSFSMTDWTAVDRIEFRFDYFQQNWAVDYSVRGISLPDACEDAFIVAAVEQPTGFQLAQNFPNPFNPVTSIQFSLEQMAEARLEVFDMAGRSVALLAEGLMEAGAHQLQFDASGLSSGVYFYTLSANGVSDTKKMVLLK